VGCCVVVCHYPGYGEEAEEEGETVVAPARAVHDFNEYSVSVVLILLDDRERNDGGKRTSNVEEGIVLTLDRDYVSEKYLGNAGEPGSIESVQETVEQNEANEYPNRVIICRRIIKVCAH